MSHHSFKTVLVLFEWGIRMAAEVYNLGRVTDMSRRKIARQLF